MCSEPLVMNLDIRVLLFASTKVKLMSLFYKPFDRCVDPWHRVFCFGHFDRLNLSKASTKPVLNLTHVSLTDM